MPADYPARREHQTVEQLAKKRAQLVADLAWLLAWAWQQQASTRTSAEQPSAAMPPAEQELCLDDPGECRHKKTQEGEAR